MENNDKEQSVDTSKRNFVKKASYIAPAIISMTAMPAFASSGSGWNRTKGNEGVGNGYDPAPPGHHGVNYNDFEGTRPGRPGHRHPRR
ncbi:MAG: hypothetical protein OQK76_11790 [Gammaproteobacteria bacterium]|nr:hypothetical protein [Gammaproteobacteria bacterium]MCW8911286.1 hypothetical protein [Gammaproteobacteria bacterium]MCW9004497.1 hypothetical protein [Gammaproteobacteria bacterium]